MNESITCEQLDFDELLTGPIDEALTLTIDAHIASCTACRRRLEQQAGSDQWWNDCRDALAHSVGELEAHDAAGPWALTPAVDAADGNRQSFDFVMSTPSHPEMLGRIGRYDVEQFLGSGGMGMVFKGFDSELNRPVAVKVLSPHLAGSGVARQRFAREARAAASIVHEHVVSIHDVQATADVPFLVMQYVPGHSLQELVERSGALEPREVVRIGMQIAAGLEAAHAQGVIHRDIKPANIMLENDLGRTVITDFGLAQAADEYSLTRTGTLAGTPHYMSPEQAESETVDHRTDLFSLGSVMYFMATGRPPFRASRPLGVLHRICRDEPAPLQVANPDMPEPLAVCVDRLLAKSPEERPVSATAVRQQLGDYLSHLQQPSTTPLPDSLQPKRNAWSRLARRSGAAAGVAGAAVLLLVAAFLSDQGDVESAAPDSGGGLSVTQDAQTAEPTDVEPELVPLEAVDDELQAVRQAVEVMELGTSPLSRSTVSDPWVRQAEDVARQIRQLEQDPLGGVGL